MIGFVMALVAGALMSVQGVFNTEVTKGTSVWVANSWVQATALGACLVIWFFTGRKSFSGLFQLDHKYMLLGGLIGAAITFTVIQSMDSLGPAKAVMFILISQMVVAYVIELFGLFSAEKAEFQWTKLIGVGMILAGIITFKFKG